MTAETNQPVTTATRTTLAGDAVRRAPIRISSRGLQDAIATTPGWATEDNGLLHARGVDDGFLYVVDGVPMYERMDSVHGIAPDPEMVESVNVIVGHVPPEFGFKSGGVIEVRTSQPQERLVARQPAGHDRQRRHVPRVVGVRRAARAHRRR